MAEEIEGLILQDGYWFPAYDGGERAARLAPYLRKMAKDAVMSSALAKRHRVCLQAGGHVGIWPLCLSWLFEQVVTCEAQPLAFEALRRNTAREKNIRALKVALGREPADLMMLPTEDSGTWRIDPSGTVPVRVVTIDSLQLEFCDVLYLDIEGHEAEALAGAVETIRRCKPVLHIELLPRSRSATEAAIEALGYQFVDSVHKDSIYVLR